MVTTRTAPTLDQLANLAVGATFSALGLLKAYGHVRGTTGGRVRPLKQPLCGSRPTWPPADRDGAAIRLLAFGIATTANAALQMTR